MQFLRCLYQICRRGFFGGELLSQAFLLHHFVRPILAELILILTQILKHSPFQENNG